jgi:hypothetical protein
VQQQLQAQLQTPNSDRLGIWEVAGIVMAIVAILIAVIVFFLPPVKVIEPVTSRSEYFAKHSSELGRTQSGASSRCSSALCIVFMDLLQVPCILLLPYAQDCGGNGQ